MLADWHGGDGMLYVFTIDADADASAGLLLASNDDYNGTGHSRIDPHDLYILPGETLLVVMTSFSEQTAIGAYSLHVDLQ